MSSLRFYRYDILCLYVRSKKSSPAAPPPSFRVFLSDAPPALAHSSTVYRTGVFPLPNSQAAAMAARDQARTEAMMGPSADVGGVGQAGGAAEAAPHQSQIRNPRKSSQQLFGSGKPPRSSSGAGAGAGAAVGKTTSGFNTSPAPATPGGGAPGMAQVWAELSGGMAGGGGGGGATATTTKPSASSL